MFIATANVRSNPLMALWQVAADLRRILLVFRGGVVGFQEIRAVYRPLVRAAARRYGYRHAHLRHRIPIVWDHRTHRRVGRGEVIRTHRGKAGASPARFLSWVVLEERATGLRFAVVNTHYVSGAWNAKRKSAKAWRRRRWVDHWDAEARLLEELHAAGYVVFAVGDLNRRDVPAWSRVQVEYVHGIDHLAMVPGRSARVVRVGNPVRLEGRDKRISRSRARRHGPKPKDLRSRRLWTDHAARGQEVRLEPRRGVAVPA